MKSFYQTKSNNPSERLIQQKPTAQSNLMLQQFVVLTLMVIGCIPFRSIAQFEPSSGGDNVNVLTFPNVLSDRCKPTNLLSNFDLNILYSKSSKGFLNDVNIKTNMPIEYQYNKRHQVEKIRANISNFVKDFAEGMKKMSKIKIPTSMEEEFDNAMKGAHDEINIELKYNDKGQVQSITMPTLPYSSSYTNNNLTSDIKIKYNADGRITAIEESCSGVMRTGSELDYINTVTNSTISYPSDYVLECSAVTKNSVGTVVKNSVVILQFNEDWNLTRKEIQIRNPNGKVVKHMVTNFTYYPLFKNPKVFNINYELILSLRSEHDFAAGDFVSNACIKQATTVNQLKEKERTTITINDVFFGKNQCTMRYNNTSESSMSDDNITHAYNHKDYYFIRFYAYNAWTTVKPVPDCSIAQPICDLILGKSIPGHIFVGFFKNGFPEETKGFEGSKKGWFVTGPPGVKDQEYLVKYAESVYTSYVSEENYKKAKAINTDKYVLLKNDCVSYAADIAEAIKLKTPSLLNAILTPIEYIRYLIDNNQF